MEIEQGASAFEFALETAHFAFGSGEFGDDLGIGAFLWGGRQSLGALAVEKSLCLLLAEITERRKVDALTSKERSQFARFVDTAVSLFDKAEFEGNRITPFSGGGIDFVTGSRRLWYLSWIDRVGHKWNLSRPVGSRI